MLDLKAINVTQQNKAESNEILLTVRYGQSSENSTRIFIKRDALYTMVRTLGHQYMYIRVPAWLPRRWRTHQL